MGAKVREGDEGELLRLGTLINKLASGAAILGASSEAFKSDERGYSCY